MSQASLSRSLKEEFSEHFEIKTPNHLTSNTTSQTLRDVTDSEVAHYNYTFEQPMLQNRDHFSRNQRISYTRNTSDDNDDSDGAASWSPKKRKTRDDDEYGDGAGNWPPKKRRMDDGLVENDILSDVAIQKALRAGYTVPEEIEGFESLLPVRVSFR